MLGKKYLYAEVAKPDCTFRQMFGKLLWGYGHNVCKLSDKLCEDPSKCPYGKELKDISL